MENLIDSIFRITVGIRYQRSFGLLDSTGEIVDSILHDDDSPFAHDFFTEIAESIDRGKILARAAGQTRLSINSDDLIFQYSFESGDDFKKRFEWISKKCVPYFINKILSPHRVKKYMRLGMVFSHDLPNPPFLNQSVINLTDDSFSNPETIVVRFSKRLPVDEALVKKGVNDWENVIFTVQNKTSSTVNLEVDLQHYFDPLPNELPGEFDYAIFFNGAKDRLISGYHKMLQQKFVPLLENSNGK